MSTMKGLREAMRDKRRELGLSVRALGRHIGVSFSTLARIERGMGDPDPHVRVRILNWLTPETALTCHCTRCATPVMPAQGWECPRCHRMYSPFIEECQQCRPL